MNDSTHKPNPPINPLLRDNPTDALTTLYCALHFLSDYVYLTMSRADTTSNCANVGFFNVMNMITEALKYEIAKVDSDGDGIKAREVAELRPDATKNAAKEGETP